MMREEKKILEKIEKVESQIVLLNDLKRKLVNGLDTPHNIPLAFPQNSFEKQKIPVIPIITIERISLFRSLFRGRDDVYARLWVSRKTGKSGYSIERPASKRAP